MRILGVDATKAAKIEPVGGDASGWIWHPPPSSGNLGAWGSWRCAKSPRPLKLYRASFSVDRPAVVNTATVEPASRGGRLWSTAARRRFCAV